MERIGKIVVLPSSMTNKSAVVKSSSGSHKIDLESLSTSDHVDDEDVDFAKLSLPESIESRLFDHQKDGVKWMYGLYLKSLGGILGDDMGLGKTFQVTCLLIGLMRLKLIQRVLIIAPVSVLPSWSRELETHLAPHISGVSIEVTNADMSKKKRLQILEDVFSAPRKGHAKNPCVVITSYQLVAGMIEDFSGGDNNPDGSVWDYVILDEGHLIKNPSTKTSKAMHMLRSHNRLILTGTPVQNNLCEFWAIADWATSGRRFGSLSHFKERFATPIMNGQDPRVSDLSS
jgi:SNF2 family DNA or RNA helicase